MSKLKRLPLATLILTILLITAIAIEMTEPAQSRLHVDATLALKDCKETAANQSEIQTSRGNKAGESMGFAVQTYQCRANPDPATEGEVQGLPWESNEPKIDSGHSPEAPPVPLPVNSEECQWHAIPPPAAGDARWEGNDPATGTVIANDCNGPTVYRFMAGPNIGAAPTPPPPTPQELAEQAYREIAIPAPQMGAGPDREKLAVNLWTWLWTDDPGPQTITVAAGGISVTATATLTSVTWSLGEPAPTGGAYAPGPPVTITCQGTGTAPPPDYDWKAEPPCGHKYTWMSTADRTGGTGKWPVLATTNWAVTWQSNTGVSGATTLSATGTDALEIGEYRTVLVQGAGG